MHLDQDGARGLFVDVHPCRQALLNRASLISRGRSRSRSVSAPKHLNRARKLHLSSGCAEPARLDCSAKAGVSCAS